MHRSTCPLSVSIVPRRPQAYMKRTLWPTRSQVKLFDTENSNSVDIKHGNSDQKPLKKRSMLRRLQPPIQSSSKSVLQPLQFDGPNEGPNNSIESNNTAKSYAWPWHQPAQPIPTTKPTEYIPHGRQTVAQEETYASALSDKNP